MLLWYDSFDFYTTGELEDRYEFRDPSGVRIDASVGRFGSGGLESDRALRGIVKIIPETQTLIVGVAVKWTDANANDNTTGDDIIVIRHGGAAQIDTVDIRQGALKRTVDGKLEYRIGNQGDSLGISEEVVHQDTFYYVELKVNFHPTTGSVEVRLNEKTVITNSNVNTDPRGSGSANMVGLHVSPEDTRIVTHFDDFYVCDDTGSDNNDFLGDVHIEAIIPDAIGDVTEWGPVAASPPKDNWELVAETAPDDDANYVLGSAVGQRDTYGLQNLSTQFTTINAISVEFYERGEAGIGTPLVVPDIYTGGTHFEGNLGISTIETYEYRSEVIENSPNTNSAWTVDDINDLEIGPKIKSL